MDNLDDMFADDQQHNTQKHGTEMVKPRRQDSIEGTGQPDSANDLNEIQRTFTAVADNVPLVQEQSSSLKLPPIQRAVTMIQTEQPKKQSTLGPTSGPGTIEQQKSDALFESISEFHTGSPRAEYARNTDHKDYNPYEGLSHLQKIKTDYDLSSSTITPFNKVQFIQTMFNPLSHGIDREMITVQLYHPSVKRATQADLHKAAQEDMDMLRSSYRLQCMCETTDWLKIYKYSQICRFCDQKSEVNYGCFQCNFWICRDCNLKHYRRHNMLHQTSKHHFYETYKLQAHQHSHNHREVERDIDLPEHATPDIPSAPQAQMLSEDPAAQQLQESVKTGKPTVITAEKTEKDEKELERKNALIAKENISVIKYENANPRIFADVVVDDFKGDKESQDTTNGYKKYMVVGFWQFSNGMYKCYRQFKIILPCVTRYNWYREYQEFFHLSENNELYFFDYSKDENNRIQFACNFVDLKLAMSLSDTHLNRFNHILYQMPIKERFVIPHGTQLKQMMDYMFSSGMKQPIRCKPKMYDLNIGKVLVLSLPLVWATDSQKWYSTDDHYGDNLIFTKLAPNGESEVIFTAYDASLLLNIKVDEESGEVREIMFLRNSSVVTMNWMEVVSEKERSQKFIKSGSAPLQRHNKVYMFLPNVDENFILAKEELEQQIERAHQKRSTIDGRVHPIQNIRLDNSGLQKLQNLAKPKLRVSLILGYGGCYSFNLIEATSMDQESLWQGEIGEVQDFNIMNFCANTLLGEGDDPIRGAFIVKGKQKGPETHNWVGYYIESGKQYDMSIDFITFHGDGRMVGMGTDLHGKFDIEGALNDERTQFSMVKVYSYSTGNKIYYRGLINMETNYMQGYYRFSEDGEDVDIFKIKMEFKKPVTLKITYTKTKKPMSIYLDGEFDLVKKTLSGTFTCSKNLERSFLTDSKDPSKNRFVLTGHECQDRAEKEWSSARFADAQFCQVPSKNDDSKMDLYIVGNLSHKKFLKGKMIGYQTLNFESINLSTPVLDIALVVRKLSCQVPKGFSDVTDARGKISHPYYRFMPFEIELNRKTDEIKWKSQMFYFDMSANCIKLLYLKGTHLKRVAPEFLQNYLIHIDLPQCESTMVENYTVSYPILAYKTSLPMDNQIAIVNLIYNTPQKLININPYRFVQFIEMGMHPEKILSSFDERGQINTCIFFLVERDNKFFVMYYRCFPFLKDKEMKHIDHKKRHEFQIKPQIYIFNGYIDIMENFQKIDNTRFSFDKIMKATLLTRQGAGAIQTQVCLQLMDQIVCFNMNLHQGGPDGNNNSNLTQIQKDGQKMIKYYFQRGPSEQVYFAESNEVRVDQLVCLSFEEKDNVTKEVVYRCDGAQLVAFQVSIKVSTPHDGHDIPHQIYILLSDKKLKVINYNDEQFSIETIIKLDANPKVDDVINRLNKTVWNQIVMSKYILLALVEGGQNHEELISIAYSNESEFSIKQQEVGFQDDRRYALIRDKRTDLEKKKVSVRQLQQIPWISKNIQIAEEAKNSFFLIQHQLSTKRLDFLRADTQSAIREQTQLIGNHYIAIKFIHINSFMLFDQKDMTFRMLLGHRLLWPLSKVEKGYQYFAADNPEKGARVWDQILRINPRGKLQKIYDDVSDELKRIQEEIFDPVNEDHELNIKVNILKKSWALNCMGAKEHLLCCFAISYYEKEQRKQIDINRKSHSLTHDDIKIQVIPTNHYLNEQLQFTPLDDLSKSMTMQKGTTLVSSKIVPSSQSVMVRTNSSVERIVKTPTVLVLRSPYFNPTDSQQIIFTQDYLVFKTETFIFWAKRDNIKKAIGSYFKSQKNNILALSTLQKFKKIIADPDACSVGFQCLDTRKVSEKTMKHGFKICTVAKYDLKIVEKATARPNVIQISFSDVAVIWDLKDDREVSFCEKPTDFASQKAYVPTGFVPHVMQSQTCTNMNNARYYRQNEDRSLVMSPDTDETSAQIIRTYKGINLMDVIEIERRKKQNLVCSETSFETMLMIFNGLTFFQIFRDYPEFTEQLYDKIKNEGIDQQTRTDEEGNTLDAVLIRQIYWILQMPEIKENKQAEVKALIKRTNIIQSCVFNRQQHQMIDRYLNLIMLSREYRLSDLIGNYNCFERVFNINSAKIQEFLEESHIENTQSLEVTSLLWNPIHELITFGTNHSLLSADDIIDNVMVQQMKLKGFRYRALKKAFGWVKQVEQYFDPKSFQDRDSSLKTTNVRVRILEVEWLASTLPEFYNYLNLITDSNVFSNEFIKILLQQQNYSFQLGLKVFLPQLSLMACNLLYFSYYVPLGPNPVNFLATAPEATYDNKFQAFLRVYILIGIFCNILIEINQIIKTKFKYFRDVWNQIFWGNIVMTLLIVMEHGANLGMEQNTLIQLSSVSIVLQWLFFYYWMRLFPQLAFYVTMIYETIKDIGWFMVMFVLCIATFANASFVLNKMQPPEGNDPYDQLWNDAFNEDFSDSFLNQYLVGLGEFNLDPFNAHPASELNYIYFILATLFSQIIFLNMLIAIMGETFGRVSEQHDNSELMERTHLYADYLWAITLTKELYGKRYLYVVKPLQDKDMDHVEVTEAATKTIVSQMQRNDDRNQHDLEVLTNKVHSIMTSHHKMRIDLEDKVGSTQREMREMNKKFDQILERLPALN